MQRVRLERVRELLKRQLGEILRREAAAGGPLVTVNEVELTTDLKSATAYVGILGGTEAQEKTLVRLNQERARFQELVARAVVLKHTPRLRFLIDHSVERGNRVLAILDEIERSSPPDSV